jgi:urease accessory protein UreF
VVRFHDIGDDRGSVEAYEALTKWEEKELRKQDMYWERAMKAMEAAEKRELKAAARRALRTAGRRELREAERKERKGGRKERGGVAEVD